MVDTPTPVLRSMDSVEVFPVDRTTGTSIQILLGPEEGADSFYTRRFTIEPGGRIPAHRHDAIEHQQVVLEGEMVLGLGDREVEARTGDCLLIPARVAHWYENRGQTPVRFLCIVPRTAEYQTEWLE